MIWEVQCFVGGESELLYRCVWNSLEMCMEQLSETALKQVALGGREGGKDWSLSSEWVRFSGWGNQIGNQPGCSKTTLCQARSEQGCQRRVDGGRGRTWTQGLGALGCWGSHTLGWQTSSHSESERPSWIAGRQRALRPVMPSMGENLQLELKLLSPGSIPLPWQFLEGLSRSLIRPGA